MTRRTALRTIAHRGLIRDRSGNVTVLFAGALTMLLGAAALGVDSGTMFLEKRRLQGVADAAALAAATDPTSAQTMAQSALSANAGTRDRLTLVTTGGYTPDPAIASATRFAAGATPTNAAQVAVETQLPTFFARAFSSAKVTTIAARATAARIDLAAFSIGSRLAGVQGGLPNALLSGLAGTELNLNIMDYNALLSGQVDVLRFADALRTTARLDGATFAQVLAARVTLPQAVAALAAATTDGAAAAALRAVSLKLPHTTLTGAQLIDLGPLGATVAADPARPVNVDAFSILRVMLEIAGGSRQVSSAIDLAVPGIASSRMTLEIGERRAGTPWLAVNAARKATVRTAQTRLAIDTVLAQAAPLGIGTIRLPFYIELAEAEATLSDVSCARGRDKATVRLDVTPAVGRAAIASFDRTALSDFSRPLALEPATITAVPLISVTAFADITLGGVTAQPVHFTAADIAARQTKTVSTNDVLQGVASSLVSRTTLKVNVVGLGLGTGLIGSTVGSILTLVAPALDGLIDQVTALAGVRVGQADVTVNGVRCGTPTLVA